ncbi:MULTISPECIES: flavodoxin family protein [unclassified Clostridium]|uniref:Flavodoxin n=1 Tax=Clostridium botulinum (strain Eklund 17B / Type B) TaxID=935198 RepID=B2TPH4_CLOBB|nr:MULTISPECIES: flavodoxin family protein [unclassified Clostridium]ACD23146.1 flavodoxin [Clostridium botulinum B str. Eklund 17B (NRP)]MBN1046378.1 flavodoxin family protein [Clostridium botulinum]MBY6975315.1 flavodoxin family protein [Clostridium botulinum]MBY7000864.1 flavodoxin family protein [Clostridium botulinum]MCR1273630.1 flavodoxin family protein [Clostridium botulinum]
MKISIIYFSKTGKTKEMANIIASGMKLEKDIEVGLFDIDNINYDFLNESKAVIFGTPTYYANTCWQIKKWFDESSNCNLSGKIGAVFATANYAQGGADTAILTIINHLMVKGMLVYSGGSSLGQPYIHLGAVALKENFEKSKDMFKIFGTRIAQKTNELFSD